MIKFIDGIKVWRQLIDDSVHQFNLVIDQDIKAYLSQVLLRYQRDEALLTLKPYSKFMYCSHYSAMTMSDILTIGESCLVISGLNIGRPQTNYIRAGKHCYQCVAQRLPYSASTYRIYSMLAKDYQQYVRLLNLMTSAVSRL
ncbi:MAG: hypothetical protein ACON5A_00395 [Candidatus Comchoanobacterales bacterium]